MRNRRRILWAGLACVAASGLAVAIRSNRDRPPELPAGSIASLEFRDRLRVVPPPPPYSTRDPSKIEAVAGAIRRGVTTEDHKCGETARLVFLRVDGSELKIGLLPGHDPRYYEFRVFDGPSYSIFRVDRAPFLDAMARIGGTDLDPGQPE